MEEHRKGTPAARKIRTGTPVPGLHLRYPDMWIVLIADNATDAEAFLAAFRSAGINVALSLVSGGREGTAIAQKYGARQYPDGSDMSRILADLSSHRSSPAYIIDLRSVPSAGTISLSEKAKSNPKGILARELLFMLHPDHVNLLSAQDMFIVS